MFKKSITPIMSIVLLILLTISVTGVSYVWINNFSDDFVNSVNEGSQELDSSNYDMEILSVYGDHVVVRNNGKDNISEVYLIVNGEEVKYTLSVPLGSGETTNISYDAQSADENLKVVIKTTKDVELDYSISRASENTEDKGFLDSTFFNDCPEGSEVVNFENKRTGWYNSDSHSCGCNITTTINSIINGDFEDGNNSWSVISESGASINEVYEGTYSMELKSYDSFQPSKATQIVDGFVDSINSKVYYNKSAESGEGYAGIWVSYAGSPKYIIYVINGSSGVLSYCNNFQGDYFIDCSYNVSSDQWNSFNITGIYNEYKEKFPSVNLKNKTTEIILFTDIMAGSSNIQCFYDNIQAYNTNNGLYCDNDNYGNSASGVCYNQSCVDYFIEGFDRTDYYLNENPLIIVDLISFETPTCNLNIDGNDYSMNVNSTNAYYQLPSYLNKGDYETNVSCENNISESIKTNISSNFLYYNWTLDLNDLNYNIGGEYYHLIGELDSSYEGKEILTILGNNRSINIYSSNGEYINNISVSNNKLFLPPPPYNDSLQEIHAMAIGDVDNDLNNDIVVVDATNVYLFNSSLDRLWNYSISYSSPKRGGMAISNINNDPKLEILVNTVNGLTVLNSSGGLLWEYNAGGIINYFSSMFSPVVQDINLDNSGVEILTVDPDDELVMLDSDGNKLYSFNISDSPYLYVSPSVAELNSSNQGLETVYITNSSTENMTIYLLNSTLNEIWEYNYSYDNGSLDYDYMNIPKSIAIGDVTGDGENEIIVSFVNNSNWEPSDINDHILILDNNGSLITDYVTKAHDGFNPILLELDSTNNGLEIVSTETNYLKVINYKGEVLYSHEGGYATGPIVLADDIDNDGYLEIICFESGGDEVIRYETMGNSTNNIWPTFKHDLNQTGYQN